MKAGATAASTAFKVLFRLLIAEGYCRSLLHALRALSVVCATLHIHKDLTLFLVDQHILAIACMYHRSDRRLRLELITFILSRRASAATFVPRVRSIVYVCPYIHALASPHSPAHTVPHLVSIFTLRSYVLACICPRCLCVHL